jgi:hypothetical protein
MQSGSSLSKKDRLKQIIVGLNKFSFIFSTCRNVNKMTARSGIPKRTDLGTAARGGAKKLPAHFIVTSLHHHLTSSPSHFITISLHHHLSQHVDHTRPTSFFCVFADIAVNTK